jgi:hypothetical protein
MSQVDAIRAALSSASLPNWVESTQVETMIDHTGDPAVRVIVVVRADRDDVVKNGAALNALSRQIRLAIDAAGIQLFPYTRFTLSGEAA